MSSTQRRPWVSVGWITHTHTHTHTLVRMHTQTLSLSYTCTHTSTPKLFVTLTHTYMYMLTHTHTHVHTHTHTHTDVFHHDPEFMANEDKYKLIKEGNLLNGESFVSSILSLSFYSSYLMNILLSHLIRDPWWGFWLWGRQWELWWWIIWRRERRYDPL